MLWDGEQVVEEKTITVTITDIYFTEGFGLGDAHYQLTFSDGNWIKTESIAVVESSLKIGHTYTLSLIKKRSHNWTITKLIEVS
jgi:hypothetical protein